ncbi:hypothetical protein BC834DRAFT_847363 [Gloeopeniophorella convolvens]|nr:hypothetical protein BC834DRAFT_847363 [Gloeopeniophorella convolvens]
MDTSTSPRLGTNTASSTTEARAEAEELVEVAEMGEAGCAGTPAETARPPASPSAAEVIMLHVVPEYEVAQPLDEPVQLSLWRIKCAPPAHMYAGQAVKVYLTENPGNALVQRTLVGSLEYYRAIYNGWVSYVFFGQDIKDPLGSEQDTFALITCPLKWAFPPGSFVPLRTGSAVVPRADNVPARYPSWAKSHDVARQNGHPCKHITAENEEPATLNTSIEEVAPSTINGVPIFPFYWF